MMAFIVGTVTGLLSGFGVGGGTLLLIYMTSLGGLSQLTAQGINLLYFLPAAALALPAHFKNGFVEKRILLPAIGAGLVSAAIGAWVATALDVGLLRRLFGGFLICVGIAELLRKPSPTPPGEGGDSSNTPPK